MKTFILRKNNSIVHIDSDYKSFGMEPSLSSPLSEIEKKLQFARSEIQMKVHKVLLSEGAGRHEVSCTSLKLSGKSLSFKLFINSIKGRDFKEDKMKKVDVKSLVSSILKEYFGGRAVGAVSASRKISKGAHDPRIAPTYDIEWYVVATLGVGRKDSSSVRKDMAMSNPALSNLSLLKGVDGLLASHYKRLEGNYKDIENFMSVVEHQIINWGNFKKTLAGNSGEEVEMDIASIDARIADLKALYGQLKNALSRVSTALKQKSALPQKLKEFTNTAAKFT